MQFNRRNTYSGFTFLLFFLCAFKISAQNKSYGTAAVDVSEIVIPASAEVRNHFNLYYEVKIPGKENANHTFWYKFVFGKDGYFNMNVFPLLETDLYDIFIFKSDVYTRFCDTNTTKDIEIFKDFKIRKEYHDDEQSELFRSTLIYTKNIEVKANDVIYLEVISIKGNDSGHILDFHTQSNAFVMKIINENNKEDLTEFYRKRNISHSNTSENVYSMVSPFDAVSILRQDLCDEKANMRMVSSLKMVGNKLKLTRKSTIKSMAEKKALPLKASPVAVSATKAIKPAAVPILKDSIHVNTVRPENNEPELEKADTIKAIPPVTLSQQVPDSAEIKKLIEEESEKSKALALALRHPAYSTSTQLNKVQTVTLENVVAVKCIVKDKEGKKLNDFKLRVYNELTGEKIELTKNENNSYEFVVEKDKKYKVECDAVGYKAFDKTLVLSDKLDKDNVYMPAMEKLKVGDNFVLKNIFFHPNTAMFKTESSASLEQLYNFMMQNKETIIEIDGHTNGKKRKKGDYNTGGADRTKYIKGSVKKLSKSRANEVKNYLVKKGIDESRIKTKGMGGSKPIHEDPQTAEEGLKNMRVEILIIGI